VKKSKKKCVCMCVRFKYYFVEIGFFFLAERRCTQVERQASI